MISFPNSLHIINNLTTRLHNFQSVRYRVRKPMWLPRAKSKMFKVPPRPVIPMEDVLELRRLHNNYHTRINSIRAYLATIWKEKTEETIDHEAEKKKFQEDFQKSLLVNQQWADQLRLEREKFIIDELNKQSEMALAEIEAKRIEEEEHLRKVDELVREVKADSKNFVTAENIDAAIDACLESTVDYNYALNLKGDKIVEFVRTRSESH